MEIATQGLAVAILISGPGRDTSSSKKSGTSVRSQGVPKQTGLRDLGSCTRPETTLRSSPNQPAWLLVFFDGRLHHKQKVLVQQKRKEKNREDLRGSMFTWRGPEAVGNPVSPLYFGHTELPVA